MSSSAHPAQIEASAAAVRPNPRTVAGFRPFIVSMVSVTLAGPTVLLATACFGVSIIGSSLSKSFALSIAWLTPSGATDMVSVLVRSTLPQLRVPGHLLGRITAINQIFIGSSNEIGEFESGVAARLLGVIPSLIFGGSMTLFVTAIAGFRAPELRRLGRLDQWSR